MWKDKAAAFTAHDAQTLRAARKQLEAVKQIRAKCNEIVSVRKSVKAQRFDGMPRAQYLPCGFDGSADEAEALLHSLDQEERKLKARSLEAKKAIDKLPSELWLFCEYYYLRGLSIARTAWMMDKNERTCWNYKAFIEKRANGNS